jgi:hypothetical protein
MDKYTQTNQQESKQATTHKEIPGLGTIEFQS